MNKPLVSICCITYNHSHYIRDAIEGFLVQKTNFPIEILIHDDASTDGTEEIIREYAAKYSEIIKPLYEIENQWVKERKGSIIFNIPRAQGKYIAMCEGDDYWTDPYKLQKQVDFLEANPEYGLVHTSFKTCDNNGKPLGIKPEITWEGHVFFAMQSSPIVSTLTTVMRKEALAPLLKRVINENLTFVMDIWIWQQTALIWKIFEMPDITATYRVHSGGITKSNSLGKLENLIVIDVYNTLFNEHNYKINFKNKLIISKRFVFAFIKIMYKNYSSKYEKIAQKLIMRHPWLLLGLIPYIPHAFNKIYNCLKAKICRKI